eukprot:9763396-Ditylum_brightwellii.AAC.1
MPSVNGATKNQAKEEAMYQLGSTINCIVATMADVGPAPFAKLDIKDRFWRLVVHLDDAKNFCYVLPQEGEVPEDDILIIVPTSLPMGWCESPSFFWSALEMAQDVIDFFIKTKIKLGPHDLKTKMLNKNLPRQKPLNL